MKIFLIFCALLFGSIAFLLLAFGKSERDTVAFGAFMVSGCVLFVGAAVIEAVEKK
jgi:hypothetical protein